MKRLSQILKQLHPIIRESRLSIDDKLALQYLLETEFNNDFKALIADMMEHAVEQEQYELAAIIRDELKGM